MRRSILILYMAVVFSVVLSFSCGRSKAETPSETVVKIYMAANEGWYSTAERYIYSEVLSSIKQNFGTLYIINIWDKYTKHGEIQRIEIVEELIRGERAEVLFKVHFKDNQVREDRDMLIKENRLWKILFDFEHEHFQEETNTDPKGQKENASEEK